LFHRVIFLAKKVVETTKSRKQAQEAVSKAKKSRKSVPQYGRTPLEKIILSDTELRQGMRCDGDEVTSFLYL
jgi:hypothetical protein